MSDAPPSRNPYRAPTAQPKTAEEPSLLRLVVFRAIAVGLVLAALFMLFALLLVALSDPIRLVGFGLLVQLAIIAGLVGGARMMWIRAPLTPTEVHALDEATDFDELVVILSRNEDDRDPSLGQGSYKDKTNRELSQIFEQIDPERAGDRYHQLLNAIAHRVAERDGADRV